MIDDLPADIEAAINAKVASGMYPNRIAVLRDALASLDEFEEDLDGLKTSIANWQAGDRGMPIEDAFALIRREMQEKK
jgi:Arc/MetJ-type ribon-helix-helix transcriptional regulator